ncbi:dUTPase [Yersinia phage vB_Yru_GN1]|jgi:dimeric dUTPase (all-alpha-NTP-PPase superfamily)|uniref:dUTPase n=1 Tax=Yersinia phage vB_Yru_GN1 TaxID=3074381 RepID=A0AA86MGX6_9CAUD|nr:dUTPase [Yersinia phage vB_Yru_GN1]
MSQKVDKTKQESLSFFQDKIQGLQLIISSMLKTQHENNVLTKGPEYLLMHLDWTDAIFVESAELIDSTAYKWWKKQDLDLENCKTELVDIWHFLMSMFINRMTNNIEHVDSAISRITMGNANLFGAIHQSEETLVKMFDGHEITGQEIRYHIKKLTKRVLNNEEPQVIILAFIDAMTSMHLSLNELYTRYMIKNALNRLRQLNGYTDGTYRKQWISPISKFPVEDNVAALGLIMGKQFNSVDEVVVILQNYYNDPASVVSDQIAH